jgi:hypothetical protein
MRPMNAHISRISFHAWCLEELKEALSHEVFASGRAMLEDPLYQEASYQVAVSLGQCSVYGVQLPDEIDGVLPVQVAIAAAIWAQNLARKAADHAHSLPERWDRAFPAEADQLCAELLQTRHEIWCATQAIHDAYEESLYAQDERLPQLEEAIDALGEACTELDDALSTPENLSLLSTLASLPLLKNWRDALVEPYRTVLPWWLSGTLEAEAPRVNGRVAHQLAELHDLAAEPTLSADAYDASELVVQYLKLEPPADVALERLVVEYAKPAKNYVYPIELVPALAAAERDVKSPISGLLQWQSPDGTTTARLWIPRKMAPESVVPLELLDRSGRPRTEWAGRRVELAQAQAVVDNDAVARFTLEQLMKIAIRKSDTHLELPGELPLTVDGTQWVPTTAE